MTTWKANTYFKVILLKIDSLLLMGCQHIRRAFTDVFQWRDGGVTKFLQLHIKRDVYVPWGFFFLNQRKELSALIRFSEIFISGKKAGWEVIQICGLKLSTYLQCNLEQVTYTL